VALPVGVLGLVLGIVGLIASLARQGRGIGFSIAGSAVSLLAVLIAGLWLGLLGGVAKSLPEAAKDVPPPTTTPVVEKPKEPPPVEPALVEPPPREYKYREVMVFGDLGVAVTDARETGYTSTTASGRRLFHNPAFVVTIKFKNYNRNRIIKAGAQVDVATLDDNVGNRYDRIEARSDLGLAAHIEGQIERGYVRPVRSDEEAGDVLVFDRPVEGASTLTLTLDASRYGGSGKVKVKIRLRRVRPPR
jgi:hypothetical protein